MSEDQQIATEFIEIKKDWFDRLEEDENKLIFFCFLAGLTTWLILVFMYHWFGGPTAMFHGWQ